MKQRLITLLMVLIVGVAAFAADACCDSKDYLNAKPEAVEQFRKDRFGMFIHWGPISLKGTEIGWSRGIDRFDRKPIGMETTQEYDNLYKEFNPVQFEPNEWVKIAKDAGMNYMVFTAKHMGGFCMFDTNETDHKITSPESPYGRDIVKQLADACRKHGLKFSPYYCIADWYYVDKHDDYETSYKDYIHNQIKELCTHYGPIQSVWFDSGPHRPPIDTPALFKMIRKLQPDALINNRTLDLPGDYDTPEQKIGRFEVNEPWETCMTLGDQWAWKPDDRIKTLNQCIYILVHTMAGGGNLLLNVGPMPDGRIEPRQVERLKEIGQWLDKYGHTILDAQPGPFKSNPWCASTYKDNTIYLHLTRTEGVKKITLPPIGHKITQCTLLTGGKVKFKQNDDKIMLRVKKSDYDSIDTIVKMELDGPAKDIAPLDVFQGPLEAVAAKASSTHDIDPWWGKDSIYGSYPPERAIDDNFFTIWMAKAEDRSAWFEVDLGKSQLIDRLLLKETHNAVDAFSKEAPGAIEAFNVEYKTTETEDWRPLFADTAMGDDYLKVFEPTTVRFLKINITEADGQIGLRQIHPYSPVVK